MKYIVDGYGVMTDGEIVQFVGRIFSDPTRNEWLNVTPCTNSGRPSRKYCGFKIHVTTLFERPAVCVYGSDSCAHMVAVCIEYEYKAADGEREPIVAYHDSTRPSSIVF